MLAHLKKNSKNLGPAFPNTTVLVAKGRKPSLVDKY